ncbi:MAG: acyl-CoA thioesterase [Bacteroidetes bacterium]|nr:acyl-CoA thioesterase [Bacteroidota bacterium]
MSIFPSKLELRIDWSEMDLFGHVNNVMYFKYIQASRVNYWELSGLVKHFQEDKIGPILANTSCQFVRPLHYPGKITVQAGIEFMKNTSFGIHHQILNEAGEIAAEAHDVIVYFNFNKNEKTELPASFRHSVAKLENRTF